MKNGTGLALRNMALGPDYTGAARRRTTEDRAAASNAQDRMAYHSTRQKQNYKDFTAAI